MTSETFDVRALVGQMVRVRKTGKSQHAIIGRLLQIRGEEGEVQLANHRGTEWLQLEQIRPWRKGMAQDEERIAKRTQSEATVAEKGPKEVVTKPVVLKAKEPDGRWTEEERAARAFRASLDPLDRQILDASAALRAAIQSRNAAREIAGDAEVARDTLREQLALSEEALATAAQLVADEQAKVDAAKAVLDALVTGAAE